MKRCLFLTIMILLAACAAPAPAPTPVPPTSTPEPSSTPVPSPTLTATSTASPTPEPYLLEDGTLLEWDEAAGDYQVVGDEIAYVTKTAEGQVVAKDSDGQTRFSFDGETWTEEKVDPNYGYIAPAIWGEESLPLVKEWWENYKEKMPTNEDIKWMTYEDGSKVEMGEIPGLEYTNNKTFGVILADVLDLPDSIDEYGHEKMLLTFVPTNPEGVEEAGNIVPMELRDDDKGNPITLRIIEEDGAIRGERHWTHVDVRYNMSWGDLYRFLQAGLGGEGSPLYGCQLAVSISSTGGEKGLNTKFVKAMFGGLGDGDWEVDSEWDHVAPNPQSAGLFAIPESCMTEEMWEVFRTLPNNPIGG